MRIADLFAGIGGIKLAFENSGFRCVYSNDIDPYCKITYEYNFSSQGKGRELFELGDISEVVSQDLPDFDVLTGGFPCQPFSIAGYRKGFSDERGPLFFEIVRLIRDRKPNAFMLENVKNMKTHNSGNTLKIIYNELEGLGYHVKDSVLNTMEYGNIPQNRERIYIVGFHDRGSFDRFKFPSKIPLKKTIYDCFEKGHVDSKYYYNGKPLFARLSKEVCRKDTIYQWRRKYVRENKKGVCPTLTANMGTGGHNVPLIVDEYGIRKLTPRECANFQGFPPNYKMPAIVDSQLYKQFGNSVSVPVVERIATNIFKALDV